MAEWATPGLWPPPKNKSTGKKNYQNEFLKKSAIKSKIYNHGRTWWRSSYCFMVKSIVQATSPTPQTKRSWRQQPSLVVRNAISTGSSRDLSLRKTVVVGLKCLTAPWKTHTKNVFPFVSPNSKNPQGTLLLKAFNGTGINCISLRQGATLGTATDKPGSLGK